jgi:putative transposase
LIVPGSLGRSVWIESFNGRFREELLSGWRFVRHLETRVIIEVWRIGQKGKRHHTAHGDLTPNEFAARWDVSP